MKGSSPVPPAQGIFLYSKLNSLIISMITGGFLVIRPSLDTFEEFRNIIKVGDHTSRGWGNSGIGNFWGGQTIQGIIPYFYYSVHRGLGQEVNRCIYNCMVDNPYHAHNPGKCLDGNETCEDCRLQKIENVKSAHFTICQKPWTCTVHTNPRNKVLCEQLHNRWFEFRDELERETKVDLSYRKLDTKFKHSLGMCRNYGDDKYLPIPLKTS